MLNFPDQSVPIVITGPGGWIGSALLAHLSATGGQGWHKRVQLFGSQARMLTASDGAVLPVRQLSEIDGGAVEGALVVHLAYLTKEKVEQVGDANFFASNHAIDQAVLDAMEQSAPRALFVASSGAAKLAEDGRDRHLYGLGKLLQEESFIRFGLKKSVPVLAGRIFNIAGPYINKLDSYAISSFLAQAIERGEIQIKARTPVFRAYLHVDDLCALIMAALQRGLSPPRAIDLCGDLTVEMADIAREVARITGIGPDAIHRETVDYTAPSIYLGDASDTKVVAMQCGIELAPFSRQVSDTAAFVRSALTTGNTP